MEKKLIRKNDIVLIGGLACGLFALLLILFLSKSAGNEVVVSVDGTVTKTFSLSENVTYEIQGYDGGRNLLIIENGEAYLKEASCPDHLCIHMGRIKSVGQSIICLPNRVTVEIRGSEKSGDEYDTTVG